MTKFLNISTDNTLGGNSPSDDTVVSQKAIKDYIDGYAMANTSLSNLTPAGKTVCANMAMPSDRYDNLTLGASGNTYTAPADGWFLVSKTAGTANSYLNIVNSITYLGYTVTAPDVTNTMRLSVPVTKGDIIQISYNMTGATQYFRFIYANGAQ